MDPDPRRDPGSGEPDEILDTPASRRYAERMAARAARGEAVGDVASRRASRRRPERGPGPAAAPGRRAQPAAARTVDDYAGDLDALAESAPAAESGAAATAGRARNTAIFSLLTGFSRIAGLIREMLANGFYGTTGPASAFTLAFQIPNLLRSLFADAALSAAFVPVFSDLLSSAAARRRSRSRPTSRGWCCSRSPR